MLGLTNFTEHNRIVRASERNLQSSEFVQLISHNNKTRTGVVVPVNLKASVEDFCYSEDEY